MPVVCVCHQVAVKVIEVQQLAGLDVDPVIRVQVGDKRKYSSIKQSTNSPYYDEVSGCNRFHFLRCHLYNAQLYGGTLY